MNLASEGGAARLPTAARLGMFLVLFTVLAFDLSAVVVNIFQLDSMGRSAALAAADAWRVTPRTRVVEATVAEHVTPEASNVEVSRIAMDPTTVWVTLRRPPAVIVLDKVPAVRERLDISVTQHAALDPAGL